MKKVFSTLTSKKGATIYTCTEKGLFSTTIQYLVPKPKVAERVFKDQSLLYSKHNGEYVYLEILAVTTKKVFRKYKTSFCSHSRSFSSRSYADIMLMFNFAIDELCMYEPYNGITMYLWEYLNCEEYVSTEAIVEESSVDTEPIDECTTEDELIDELACEPVEVLTEVDQTEETIVEAEDISEGGNTFTETTTVDGYSSNDTSESSDYSSSSNDYTSNDTSNSSDYSSSSSDYSSSSSSFDSCCSCD